MRFQRLVTTRFLPAAAPALAAAVLGGCRATVPPPAPDPQVSAVLTAWLDENGKDPVEYVVGLFADHDVVLLGEHHRIRHDPIFVQSLVEPLHQAGVRTLATEFGRREDQPQIDALLAAPDWNEELARTIVFNQFFTWGYQEYVDIYRAAWAINRSLPPGAPQFRILGVNDSPDWSVVKTPEDRDDPKVMARVWRGGGEDQWARAVLEAVTAGEKVLVYCGIHHAFSRYRQPVVVEGVFYRFDDSRMGNHLERALGSRVATVYLHAPWHGARGYNDRFVHPAGGAIDAVTLTRAGGPRPVGFDVAAGSPFGDLTAADCVYRHGYADFRLADYCDGWIYSRPLSEYEPVTPIAGWINKTNLETARSQIPNPRLRTFSAAQFNAIIAKEADARRLWRQLR
jgi:hypothetical protein